MNDDNLVVVIGDQFKYTAIHSYINNPTYLKSAITFIKEKPSSRNINLYAKSTKVGVK